MVLVSSFMLLVGARDVISNRITVGTFVAFYSYMGWLFEPSSAAVAMYARVKRAGGSIARVEELDERARTARCEAESQEPLPFNRIDEIVCNDVVFQIPGR